MPRVSVESKSRESRVKVESKNSRVESKRIESKKRRGSRVNVESRPISSETAK